MAHAISHDRPAATMPQGATTCAKALGAVGSIAGSTAITALTSAVFSIANPLTGAIFGATYTATALVANAICDYSGCAANNALLKTAQYGLSIILSTAAAWALCNAAGMPITFAAAALLTAASAAVGIGIALAVGGVFCCAASACLGVAVATGTISSEDLRDARQELAELANR